MDRRLICVRPMCGSGAAALLHYDYAARTVWLDPLEAEPTPGAWTVCVTHADSLRVPSGWRLVDGRAGNPLSALPTAAARARQELGYRPPLAV